VYCRLSTCLCVKQVSGPRSVFHLPESSGNDATEELASALAKYKNQSLAAFSLQHKVLIYILYRAPQCMTPRWNWDSPTPLAASKCAFLPRPKGGGGTLACGLRGGGVPILTTGETLSTLPTLCPTVYIWFLQTILSFGE
jgi:hypothetical protein